METVYVVRDDTVKYMNAAHPLMEHLYYAGENTSWVRDFNKALKYPDSNAASEMARKLHTECPVKVLLLQIEGNKVGVGEVNFLHKIA
jgi:hypothetical protein